MRLWLVSLVLLCPVISFGQDNSALTIRSIRVRLISAIRQPATPITIETITRAMNADGLSVAVEHQLDTTQLQRAGDVIQDVYRKAGRTVRVEHSITQMNPLRSVEVLFEVVELCD